VSSELLPCVEVEPSRPANAAVIWMHGLGADGHDFEPVLPWLGLPPESAIRFLFPHAPRIPVTLNQGMVMPAWYDIVEIDLARRHDREGILRSRESIGQLIEREEARGISTSRIVVAGFSQGGAVALDVALRWERRLAGVLALSTYLVLEDELEGELHPSNRSTPILQAHGTHDPMVPVDRGRACRDRLVSLGYSVRWQEYPMQHEVCPDELTLIGQWLAEVLDG
jgi:phospholipase/carboxylesterase